MKIMVFTKTFAFYFEHTRMSDYCDQKKLILYSVICPFRIVSYFVVRWHHCPVENCDKKYRYGIIKVQVGDVRKYKNWKIKLQVWVNEKHKYGLIKSIGMGELKIQV